MSAFREAHQSCSFDKALVEFISMANSKYEYVKSFEHLDNLLPNTWIVVRIDGRGFHKFSNKYGFQKPNDRRALDLMNSAAVALMKELPDVSLAYGISDEFSFLLGPSCSLFERRESKIVTTIAATFTAYYVYLWPSYFFETPLSPPLPSFDGRAVLYPSVQNLRDYFSWRQVDCHINNLYNTTFWAMIQRGGMDPAEAELELKGTLASDKNEILFSRFKINYNDEPDIFRKGSIVHRDYKLLDPGQVDEYRPEDRENDPREGASISRTQREKEAKRRPKAGLTVQYLDIIKDDFWERRAWLLSDGTSKLPQKP